MPARHGRRAFVPPVAKQRVAPLLAIARRAGEGRQARSPRRTTPATAAPGRGRIRDGSGPVSRNATSHGLPFGSGSVASGPLPRARPRQGAPRTAGKGVRTGAGRNAKAP
ncbi:hypothetical protein AVW11_29910 [Streptomyces amritsarensis]|uniref:Uncharacterized protein n=1 Tax=Streptomyces amritsarensis TaxID=681158 RepID=A0ABX3FV96_9ACTN|nr:hypothetical protein AVW11_29910 [Streptomyces amritsarensis]